MIRVLLVNDSATSRAAIRFALAGEPDIEIVGELPSAKSAVEAARAMAPDVVLMDIVMPEVDGYEATRQLRRAVKVPIVMISASVSAGDVAVAMEALRAGAIAVLESPTAPHHPRYEIIRRGLVVTLRSAAALPRSKDQPTPLPWAGPPVAAPPDARSFEAIGIVASLGGPPVLAEIFGALREDHPPILLVQHIEPSFVTGFAAWLATTTKSTIAIGESGAELRRGHIHIAPPDHHLLASAGGLVALSSSAPVGGFRPSGNVLLSSLASAYGRNAAGVVLTGMGRDGAEGALKLHAAGGFVIAQDEASCAVASMADAARMSGAVDLTLSPAAIAAYLR